MDCRAESIRRWGDGDLISVPSGREASVLLGGVATKFGMYDIGVDGNIADAVDGWVTCVVVSAVLGSMLELPYKGGVATDIAVDMGTCCMPPNCAPSTHHHQYVYTNQFGCHS